MKVQGYKILYTRWTMISAKDSIIPEFTEKIDLMGWDNGQFEVGIQDITHRQTASCILFRGIKTSSGNQTAKLKSIQGINVWVLDEAEEMSDEDSFDKIDLSVRDSRHPNLIILCLNPAHKSHWIYTRFFEPHNIPTGFCGTIDSVTYIHTDYRDNVALAKTNPQYIAIAEQCREKNWRKYENIWLGAWVDEIEGALWSYEMIHPYRVTEAQLPDMRRIVVGIDPSATSNATSDETGLVVVGHGMDGHFYTLEDLSGRYTPKGWAHEAVAAYHRHKADRIIAEVNHGGEMIEDIIRNVDRMVPYKAVRAAKNKIIRAEPVAALAESGRCHHVGTFTRLEGEMMSYTGYDPNFSPGRLDAYVYCHVELAGIDLESFTPGEVTRQMVAPDERD